MPGDGSGYLFEIQDDPFEKSDVWAENPSVVTELTCTFDAL
jgi:hypothetical protein